MGKLYSKINHQPEFIKLIESLSDPDQLQIFFNFYYDLNDNIQQRFSQSFEELNTDEQQKIINLIIQSDSKRIKCILENHKILELLYNYIHEPDYLVNYQTNDLIHAYYFLFKKNLRVTNIQYAELIALIRKYIKYTDKKMEHYDLGKEVLFLHTSELKDVIDGFNNSIYHITSSESFTKIRKASRNYFELFFKLILEIHKPDPSIKFDPLLFFELLTKDYKDLISNTVIIDYFYSSCIIYLPKSMEVELDMICAYSGYINSCGNLIYVKNVEKSHERIFLNCLNEYLNTIQHTTKFAVFSHEDYKKIQNQSANPYKYILKEELKGGLNDVKVYLEKFYMGDESLLKIFDGLHVKYKTSSKFIVPDINNLLWEIKPSETKSTIWFLIEHSIGKDPTKYGRYRYYIAYEQLYKNENQLYIFDENKPAWKSCTTIPQSLIGAIFNIALQYTDKKAINVLDPFLGTGTSLFESLKYPEVNFYGYDIDELSPILIQDNINLIFNQTIIDEFHKEFLKDTFNIETISQLSRKYNVDLKKQGVGEYDIKHEDIPLFLNEKLVDRAHLYLLFQTQIRNSGALTRADRQNLLDAYKNYIDLFSKEFGLLKAQMDELRELYSNPPSPENHLPKEFIFKVGKFSKKIILNNDVLLSNFDKLKDMKRFGTMKIEDLPAKENKYDIIITDPPYSFNVGYDTLKLAGLYKKLVEIFLSMLNDDGQIIMALPERSYSGKRSPYFTHKEIVVKNFILGARRYNFEVINTAQVLPKIALFNPPYYWEAEKALRRSIIHLRFRKNKLAQI